MSKSRKEKLICSSLSHSVISPSFLKMPFLPHSHRQDSFVQHEDETGAAGDQAMSWAVFSKPRRNEFEYPVVPFTVNLQMWETTPHFLKF